MAIAEELAKKQRVISVAEFFEKNRQILGFDSAPRSLITCVKEAVDNALDACEDASILPDIFVQVARAGDDTFLVTVEDNGPGIVKEQIPRIFAKLLYGSRFHVLKQSRGQQGIGISAAVLYSQLTSGKPTKITSRIGLNDPAHYYELIINTKINEPEILVERTTEWDRPHGTRIEMEIEASYVRGRRQSIHEYLKSTAIVNPHARLTLIEPDGNMMVFDRATDIMPPQPKEIMPHPDGIELGTLIKMLRYTERQKLVSFLMNEFSRMGRKTAEDICKDAAIDPSEIPANISHDQAKHLLGAFRKVRIQAPPMDCLSPIGEDQIYQGLEKEYDVDFISTTTRSATVHSGNPFIVEAGIAFGGSLPKEDRIEILRFANKVPLLYQQGGCAITHAISDVNWKNYDLNQSGGTGIPVGPAVVFVHVASTKVPFTSESKDAIADIPEIMNEIKLAVQEVARDTKNYLSRKKLLERRKDKEEIIKKILPKMVAKVSSILGKEEPDIRPVIAKIMGNVLVQREVTSKADGCFVSLKVRNFDEHARSFKLHELFKYDVLEAPEAKIMKVGNSTSLVWKISLVPGEQKVLSYNIECSGTPELQAPIAEGIDKEIITGAKVV
ncbi:MAG: DNA topoisomerase VI subunit B [Methanocellales archaeon]|nr:DNA topoisomerase VI subunit B [Methanocellales archaeon]MDD5446513.1 DNA topoisomerase VI subunit B [Methanocellales archaeon]